MKCRSELEMLHFLQGMCSTLLQALERQISELHCFGPLDNKHACVLYTETYQNTIYNHEQRGFFCGHEKNMLFSSRADQSIQKSFWAKCGHSTLTDCIDSFQLKINVFNSHIDQILGFYIEEELICTVSILPSKLI